MRVTITSLRPFFPLVTGLLLAACGGGGGSGGAAAPSPVSPTPPTGPQTVTKNYTVAVTEIGAKGVSSSAVIEIDTTNITSSGTVKVTE